MPIYKLYTRGRFKWAGLGIWARIAWLAMRHFSWRKTPMLLKELEARRRQVDGGLDLRKAHRLRGRYFWTFNTPAFPSRAFDRFHLQEMNRIFNPAGEKGLSMAVMAITKKCPLACKHCFEGDVLNQKEVLTPEKILRIVDRLIKDGVSQIQFSGGEPLNRFPELLAAAKQTKGRADTWVYTSGWNLTLNGARKLAGAGLTGVCVSLEHHEAAEHNRFRGSEKAFDFAQKAIENAQQSGLATALSVCVLKEFATEKFLEQMMKLARDWEVNFVQLLEPKAVGNYAGQEVELSTAQKELLEQCFEYYNFSPQADNYPMVRYHGYYQRRVGCFKDRMLYIDTDGKVEACPFCRSGRPQDYLEEYARESSPHCPAFAEAEF